MRSSNPYRIYICLTLMFTWLSPANFLATETGFSKEVDELINRLIQSDLSTWNQANQELKAAATLLITKRLAENRGKEYESSEGKKLLLKDALDLMVCINKVASNDSLGEIKTAEVATTCVILIDAEGTEEKGD